MNAIMKNTILLAALGIMATVLWGCKNDGFYYRDIPRIRMEAPYIWSLGTDSLEYSFLTSPISVTQYDMEITLHIMGEATAYDRTANITVDQSRTTATAQQYSLPTTITIPAGKYKATFNVTIQRTADLQTEGVRLGIRLLDSDDFSVGVIEQARMLLKWNDMMSRPTNWASLQEFFGDFSLVKYRFMINTTGVLEFSVDTMTWSQLTSYKMQLQTALAEYNAANPLNPLKDENNALVTF